MNREASQKLLQQYPPFCCPSNDYRKILTNLYPSALDPVHSGCRRSTVKMMMVKETLFNRPAVIRSLSNQSTFEMQVMGKYY